MQWYRYKKNRHHAPRSRRGFTLLLSALVASLLATIGAVLYVLAQKDIRLSATGRESQRAFYAADAGAECALFFNLYHDAFSTSTPFTDTQNMRCVGETLYDPATGNPLTQMGGWDANAARGITEFRFELPVTDAEQGARRYCVIVQVQKYTDTEGYPRTIIDARGYNVPCADRGHDIRTVERAVQLSL